MKSKNKLYALFIVLVLVLVLTACQSTADHDIRGTWEYSMTDSNENTYDAGTITFDGTATKGTYSQVNIYDVNYDGDYTVKGSTLTLTGDESWQGEFTDTDHISGTWNHAEEGLNGTFEAVRVK